jgi:hypothetical protein
MNTFQERIKVLERTPPSIPFERLEWEPTGCEADPQSRMLAQFSIGGIPMHLEAWRVHLQDHLQVFRCACDGMESGHCLSDSYENMAATLNSDCPFMTIEVLEESEPNGLLSEYVLIAQPHGD